MGVNRLLQGIGDPRHRSWPIPEGFGRDLGPYGRARSMAREAQNQAPRARPASTDAMTSRTLRRLVALNRPVRATP